MIRAFIKATDQILDPMTRRVVWLALASAVSLFVLLWTLVGILIVNTTLWFHYNQLDGGVDIFVVVHWLEKIG